VSRLDPSKITVLVADDEVDNGELFSRALRGYRLLVATRGDEALLLVAENRVDIVVTDQNMPGNTGALLLQRFRAVNPIARRMIVSAHVESEQLLDAINRGEVERYVLKPVDPEDLRRQVDGLAEEYLQIAAERARVAELEDLLVKLRSRLERADLAPDGWERLELEVARASRYARPLSFIIVDGRGLERELLLGSIREVDLVVALGARTVIALPETDREGAEVTRKRLGGAFPPLVFKLATFPGDGDDLTALLAKAS
jgi:CheY-like chemotaxis protein